MVPWFLSSENFWRGAGGTKKPAGHLEVAGGLSSKKIL